jgi:methyl-accepting chemotaxis protein
VRATIAERMNRRRDLLRSEPVRRRAGRAMLGVGAVGLVVATAGTVVAWRLVGHVNDATRDTLDVTVESLDSLENTLDLAEEILVSTTDSLDAVETNLDAIGSSFDTGSEVVSDLSDLSDTTGPALSDATATLRQLETLGSQIDTILATVASVPFGPDYDPENGLGATFGRLADNIEPLPVELAETSTSLDDFETTLGTLETEVGILADTIHEVNEGLDGSEALLDGYRTNVEEAQEVANRSRDDLDQDDTMLRVLILIAGVNFAATQIVPLWIGWELLDESSARRARP